LALGFLFIFFTDLLDDSGSLGVSSGLKITLDQVILATLFILGFGLLMMYSGKGFGAKTDSLTHSPFMLAYLIALGVGLHAFGEGMIMGNSLASQVPIEEMSSIFQGFSFSIHKFLEGFTVAVFFGPKPRLRTAGICTVLASLPYLAGIPLGLVTFPAILANYFFALGAGAVIFMIVQIAARFRRDSINYAAILGFVVGFLLVHLGTLIHFTEFGGA
jgi:zinc transporter ZupT